MQLTGIHHLTAVTANAPGNHDFYTRTLGLRLVKKTVNQDDVSAYHLFYADGHGLARDRHHLLRLAGRPRAPRHRQSSAAPGSGSRGEPTPGLVASAFRGTGRPPRRPFGSSDGRLTPRVRGSGRAAPVPGRRRRRRDRRIRGPASPVPAEHQIRGLGPITLSVPELAPTERVLTAVHRA